MAWFLLLDKQKNPLKKIAFLFLFISFISYSQEKISFKVLDKQTKKPIVYATVMLKKINRGTHADVNGKFEIPKKYKLNGIIRISSIGYKTKEIKLSELNNKKVHIIYLSVYNNHLDEIVIKTSKKKKRKPLAIEIVRKAIENILNNYPTEPHSYIGYYRDYQQPVGDSYQQKNNYKEKIEFLNVNEAIIESFDNGFKTDKLKSKKNQSLLYNYIENDKFIKDSTLTIPYDNADKKFSESVYISPLGGNELNILSLTNAIRNYDKMSFSFSNTFNKHFIKNHKFKLKKIVYSDKSPLYEVTFNSIKGNTSYEYAAFGTIYISKQDFAIHKLNYNLYYRFKKNPQYSVTIEYKPIKDKMYLNYITFNNFFEATNGNYFRIDKTTFNKKKKTFKISFNRPIYLKSITPIRSKFKIYYKNEKLKVTDVSINEENSRTLEIQIDRESLEKINLQNSTYATNFVFDITNIKDTNGFKINERASIKMNQYREFFVQEVFQNKKLPLNKDFVDKALPLSKSKITTLKLENNYWINTPLKSSKN